MKKYKLFILSLILIMSVSLTGCNKDIKLNLQSFNLNFRYFLLPDTQSSQALKLNAIDLNNDNTSLKDIREMNNIIFNMYSTCTDIEFYSENFSEDENFYNITKEYFNEDFYNSNINSNDFKTSIDNIYQTENAEFYNTKIISLNNKNNNKYYEAEIICVDDTETFLIEYIYIYVDSNNKIIKLELLDELQYYNNTTKALDETSLLNENNIHYDFINDYTELTKSLTNGNLYQKYHLASSNNTYLVTDIEHELSQEDIESIDYLEEMTQQLDSLIENVNYNIDTEVLKQFYLSGEGTFKNTFITDYKINDYNGLATSFYTIQSVSDGELFTFEITFDRIENKIINMTLK